MHLALLSFPMQDLSAFAYPIFEVEFWNDQWWSIPPDTSLELYQMKANGADCGGYVWNWHGARNGSFILEGQATGLSRYLIDFNEMTQKNLDKDDSKIRNVRIVWIAKPEV